MSSNLSQHLLTDYSELERIRKLPSMQIVSDAIKIGIKESYSQQEYEKLNRNKDISKTTKGDILSFVFLCHEIYDKSLILKSIK